MGDRWHIEVDRGVCIGSGMCVNSPPGGFTLDSARPRGGPGHRRRGGAAGGGGGCPVEAISIALGDSGEAVFPPEE
ncbi:ferredoxin [Streptomyces sp. PA03-3a]|nr:ferredoxin [Streptomyces sp. PA03-3a]